MSSKISSTDGSRTQIAYEYIRRQIVRLVIPPSAAFTEAEVAAQLGLSKTPVREALALLRRERLVEVYPGSGYRAASITVKDTMGLSAFRALLEGEAASLAASTRIDIGELQALEELCQSSYREQDERSIDEFLEHNTAFHSKIAQVGGNERLATALQEVLHELERLFRIGLLFTSRAADIVHEHQDLLAAIKAGDADAARAEAMNQARAAERMILDGLLSSPDILSARIGMGVTAAPAHGPG
jgi:DNA-binding GntR family transcriptional regulator